MSMSKSIRKLHILLISEDEVLGKVVGQCIPEQSNISISSKASEISSVHPPSLVLIDPNLIDEGDLVSLVSSFSNLKVPIALINVDEETSSRIIEKSPQIMGVFFAPFSKDIVSRGVLALLGAELWLPRRLMEALLNRYRGMNAPGPEIDMLTMRERNVLELASEGLSNSEIAQQLYLSTHTVKSHIHNALSKLGASNRTQGAAIVMGNVRAKSR